MKASIDLSIEVARVRVPNLVIHICENENQEMFFMKSIRSFDKDIFVNGP